MVKEAYTNKLSQIIVICVLASVLIIGGFFAWPHLKYLPPTHLEDSTRDSIVKVVILFQDNETEEEDTDPDVEVDPDELVEEFLNDMLQNPYIFAIIILMILVLVISIIGIIFYIRAKHKEAGYYSRNKPRFKNRKP